MPKIGIIYGTENTFPGALVDYINGKRVASVVAEHVKIGSVAWRSHRDTESSSTGSPMTLNFTRPT